MQPSGILSGGGRGDHLLLLHLSALESLAEQRPPASERLAEAVGPDLARMLVGALTGERGVRARRVAA